MIVYSQQEAEKNVLLFIINSKSEAKAVTDQGRRRY